MSRTQVDREALDVLFAKSAAPMLLVDDERRYVAATDAACELLAIPREQLLSMRADDLVAPDLREMTPAMFEAFIADGGQAGPFTLFLPNGDTLNTLYSATANIVPGLHLSVFISPDWIDSEADLTAEDRRPDESASVELTAREREVLSLIALGDSYPEVAAKLHLSPETVRNYTRSAREKLGARSRAHAITLALRSGQIDLDGDATDRG